MTVVKIQFNKKTDQRAISFPRDISLALGERGYTHADIRVAEDGILVVPLVNPDPKGWTQPAVLPEWGQS